MTTTWHLVLLISRAMKVISPRFAYSLHTKEYTEYKEWLSQLPVLCFRLASEVALLVWSETNQTVVLKLIVPASCDRKSWLMCLLYAKFMIMTETLSHLELGLTLSFPTCTKPCRYTRGEGTKSSWVHSGPWLTRTTLSTAGRQHIFRRSTCVSRKQCKTNNWVKQTKYAHNLPCLGLSVQEISNFVHRNTSFECFATDKFVVEAHSVGVECCCTYFAMIMQPTLILEQLFRGGELHCTITMHCSWFTALSFCARVNLCCLVTTGL